MSLLPFWALKLVLVLLCTGRSEALGFHQKYHNLCPMGLEQHEGWTAFIYTLAGSLCTGPDDDLRTIEPHHTVVLEDGECIRLENKAAEESHFVLIAGEPIKEPVVQHGPFVMNTQEEIDQTISDFRSATNGFERAKVWRSKIGQKF